MSKADLKAAMEALQVNKPMRLQNKPIFKAPEPPVAKTNKQDELEIYEENYAVRDQPTQDSRLTLETRGTQDSRVSLDSKATQETRAPLEPEGTQETEPSLETRASPETEVPLKSGGTQDTRGTQDSRPSLESRPTQEPRPTLESRVGHDQYRLSKREIIMRNERGEPMRVNKKDLPAAELVKYLSLTDEGYGSLSNRILEILFRADFDKAEHEIIQFIIRESIFWRQEWTDPLSGAEFESLSGISNSSLWTHLKRLTDRGWVEKELVKVTAKHQARNRYRLNPQAWGPLLPRKKKDTQDFRGTPETGGTQDSEPTSTQESRVGTHSGNQSGSSLYEKHSLKTDLKTSLSQAPEALNNRWSKMLDKGKSEREIFYNLFQAYGRPVWDHCQDVVEFLTTHGDLRKRPVGSPFGLLAQASNWEIFLGLALAKKAKADALAKTKEAYSTPSFVSRPPTEDTPQPPPPAELFEAFRKIGRRGPASAMKVFEGDFSAMEGAFKRQFATRNEQWVEIKTQLGAHADLVDDERAKWIAGVQRWFRGAWDRGEISSSSF